MKTNRSRAVFGLAAALVIALAASLAMAQEEPVTADAVSTAPTTQLDPIKIAYMKWLQNDIIRNVEEIKRARDPWERRDLVEDIEYIIWERVEFPLTYQQAEMTDLADFGRIGTTSDVTVGKESVPEAPQIAVSYALLGIAKGYEGFGSAATDYFNKAKGIYDQVMGISVSLDHSRDNRPLSEWISASRGYWGNSSTTRVTFYGKRVAQTVIDKMNTDEIAFVPKGRRVSPYSLEVAKRDFVQGMKRYIMTDETQRERRPNTFSIYLEPGDYELQSLVSSAFTVPLRVSRNLSENNFIIETLQDGVALYAIPDVQVFEAEMKKAMQRAQERDEDQAAAGELGEDVDFPLE
ncbi:hypothetical protein K8I61_02025 [bacterium]|nr:hypothetical protein [bacterium]